MRLARITAIIMLLLQKPRITGEGLAKRFEVSLRTIYRDIDIISQAGVPIVAIPGSGGGIGIMEQYKVDKRLFTAGDISAMLMGLGMMQNTLPGEAIAGAMAKLQSFTVEDEFAQIMANANKVKLDFGSWMEAEPWQQSVDVIRQAMEQHRIMRFAYFGRKGQELQNGIEPHRLLWKNGQWYLQAYSLSKQAFRLFKLRRMSEIAVGEETFASRELPHPFADFTAAMKHKTIPIQLVVDASAVERMLDYCTPDQLVQLNTNQYAVDFNFIADDYGYNILLGFGNQLECIAPQHVRQELKTRLQSMLALYA